MFTMYGQGKGKAAAKKYQDRDYGAANHELVYMLQSILFAELPRVMDVAKAECKPKAMLISFFDQSREGVACGGKYYQLAIITTGSYYCTFLSRKMWRNVLLEKDAQGDYCDGFYPKDGVDYSSGETKWAWHGSHDSILRGVLSEFLTKTPHLGSISGIGGWYEIVDATPEMLASTRDEFRTWCFDEDYNFTNPSQE